DQAILADRQAEALIAADGAHSTAGEVVAVVDDAVVVREGAQDVTTVGTVGHAITGAVEHTQDVATHGQAAGVGHHRVVGESASGAHLGHAALCKDLPAGLIAIG